jgi:hypothetical protein
MSLINRHGLIAGATGTGKTVTLQAMAQSFSAIGVPVFMADIKGDLSGLAAAGGGNAKVDQRRMELGLEALVPEACPVVFWDLKGDLGHPVRATISDLGPSMLGRLLGLNETQEGVLHLVFKICDSRGLLLLDFKDLRAALQFVGDNAKQFTTEYGNISPASVGAIQRALVALESQGAEAFFGEPMLNVMDFMQTDERGRGVINVLAAEKLINSPKIYSIFLLWMLSELFEQLPEVGDLAKPKLVFFFDEAHLLFAEAPKPLLEKIEQVVRLIRSKGVGVFFVTQNPLDIPETVLGQLGNRVQHALRAFTPRDQKAVKVAAETMRPNPDFDLAGAITELGVGEALVSFLDPKGTPQVTSRAYVIPPASRLGPLNETERKGVIKASVLAGHYEKLEDRESAFEKLRDAAAAGANDGSSESSDARGGTGGRSAAAAGSSRSSSRQSVGEALAKTVVRTAGNEIARAVVRGLLGSILGGAAGAGRRRR